MIVQHTASSLTHSGTKNHPQKPFRDTEVREITLRNALFSHELNIFSLEYVATTLEKPLGRATVA